MSDMIHIELLKGYYLDEVKKLVTNTNFKPYQYLQNEIPVSKLESHFYKQIVESLSDKSSISYVACIGDKVIGLAILKELDWDSDIFGVRMARIEHLITDETIINTEKVKNNLISFICCQCACSGIEHLSCRVNTDDIASVHALEKSRFRLMDTLLNYAFDFRKHTTLIEDHKPQYKVRLIHKGEDKDIAEVARVAFQNHFGRFHADKRFPRKKAAELYAEWAKNAYKGYADCIFVAEVDGRLVGYSVWSEPGITQQLLGTRIGLYGICGIHPDAHGKGIFKSLTLAGMKWLEGKADIVEGGTLVNNYPVQRGYATLGWQIIDARYTFHKWIKSNVV